MLRYLVERLTARGRLTRVIELTLNVRDTAFSDEARNAVRRVLHTMQVHAPKEYAVALAAVETKGARPKTYFGFRD